LIQQRTRQLTSRNGGSSTQDVVDRAYTIGEDGHVASFRAFVCDSDADATVWAKQLVDGHDIEPWSRDRFVIRIAHKPE
jgi:hypothetical protein